MNVLVQKNESCRHKTTLCQIIIDTRVSPGYACGYMCGITYKGTALQSYKTRASINSFIILITIQSEEKIFHINPFFNLITSMSTKPSISLLIDYSLTY